jgi:TonB family protein
VLYWVENETPHKIEEDFSMNRTTGPSGFSRFVFAAALSMLFLACASPAPVTDGNSKSDAKPTDSTEEKRYSSADSIPEFDEPPILQYFENPKYPKADVKSGRQGVVKVKVTIDKEGRVIETEILESTATEEMDAAALEAAKKCRFRPAMKDGMPVQSQVLVPFEFRLTR